MVILSGGQLASSRVFAQVLVGVVCLALLLQAAHVCQPAESYAPGVRGGISLAKPVCPVCALAQSVLGTLVLLFLFFLVPNRSRMVFVSVQAKPFWRGVRLRMRPPPVL
ncbi:MAG: hypothetical protein WAQ52_11505 [Terriglobales bacterium]